MKRADIVTLYHNNNNFGGQLQTYALQKVVSSYEIDCVVINYNSQNKYKKMKAHSFKTIASRFFHKFQMIFYQQIYPRIKADFL